MYSSIKQMEQPNTINHMHADVASVGLYHLITICITDQAVLGTYN